MLPTYFASFYLFVNNQKQQQRASVDSPLARHRKMEAEKKKNAEEKEGEEEEKEEQEKQDYVKTR